MKSTGDDRLDSRRKTLAEHQTKANLPRPSIMVILFTVWAVGHLWEHRWPYIFGPLASCWARTMELLLKRSVKLLLASFPFVKHCKTTFFWCRITSSLSPNLSPQKSWFCQWLHGTQLFPLLQPCPYNTSYTVVSQIWKATLRIDEFHLAY